MCVAHFTEAHCAASTSASGGENLVIHLVVRRPCGEVRLLRALADVGEADGELTEEVVRVEEAGVGVVELDPRRAARGLRDVEGHALAAVEAAAPDLASVERDEGLVGAHP